MRLYTIAAFLLFFNTLFSQPTFSKILDIPETDEELGTHLRVLDDELFVFGSHRCHPNPDDYLFCASIARLDFSGKLMEIDFIENTQNYRGALSLIEEDTILFLAFDESINKQGISLAQYSISNKDFNTFNINRQDNRRFAAQGIQEFNGSYYIFGHFDDFNPYIRIKGFIKKWNGDFTERLGNWEYGHDEFLRISDLRFLQDSTMVFSLYQNRVGSSGPDIPLHIVQIDTLGKIVSDIGVEDAILKSGRHANLEIDNEGFVYFNYESNFDQYLAKLDVQNDTILWTYELETNLHEFDRTHHINEIMVVNNGDIVVCGDVSYLHNFAGEDNGRISSAFIARLSSDGDLLWLKILTHDVTQNSTDDFAQSYLYDVEELENGNIVGLGQIFDIGYDLGINQAIWVIALDQYGCLEGYDCADDVYVVNSSGESYSTVITSTLELKTADAISLYPNPVAEKLHIVTKSPYETYTIQNIQGQAVLKGGVERDIDVSALPSGIYHLQLQNENELYKAIKFVKE